MLTAHGVRDGAELLLQVSSPFGAAHRLLKIALDRREKSMVADGRYSVRVGSVRFGLCQVGSNRYSGARTKRRNTTQNERYMYTVVVIDQQAAVSRTSPSSY